MYLEQNVYSRIQVVSIWCSLLSYFNCTFENIHNKILEEMCKGDIFFIKRIYFS